MLELSTVLLYLGVGALGWLVWYILWYSYLYIPFRLSHIPFPPYHSWILGNFPELSSDFPEVHLRYAREYAKEGVYGWRFFFNYPRICFTDVEAVKHILIKNSLNYVKPTEMDVSLSSVLGKGLLHFEGEEHQFHRRLCQPAFSIGSINDMIPVFDQRAQILIDKWDSKFSESASNELHVNLAHELFGVTLDIIGLVGFGHDFDMTRREEGNKYAQAFSNIILGVRDLFIWIMALRRLAPLLPLPVNRRREANMDIFRHLLFPIISQKREEAEQRIASGDSSSDKRKDLMDRLIEAYMRDSTSGKRTLNDSELIAHVLTFAFAGHETTNTAMSWAIYALSFRPDIEHKLRDEIESVMGDRSEITVQDVDKMEYMNCFTKEVLRLYPPAAITVRQAVNDDSINGVRVPSGTAVVIFPAVMHRLEQYWDKPDEFIPERWLDKSLNNNPAYIPFLMGPHSCIGQRLAVMEMRTVLAKLIRRYSFKLQPGYNPKKQSQITMKPVPEGPLVIVSRVSSD